MKLDKTIEALKPPTYEKLNELRIAEEKENAILKAELIKTKHEQSLFNERLEEELKVQAYEIYQQYARSAAIKKKVDDELYCVESQLSNIDCLEAISNKKTKKKIEKLMLKRELLIDILNTDEDEE